MTTDSSFIDLGMEEQDLYLRIKEHVKTLDSVSISEIQIDFSIGYAEAHKMLDMLTNEGLVGEEKNGRREVIK